MGTKIYHSWQSKTIVPIWSPSLLLTDEGN